MFQGIAGAMEMTWGWNAGLGKFFKRPDSPPWAGWLVGEFLNKNGGFLSKGGAALPHPQAGPRWTHGRCFRLSGFSHQPSEAHLFEKPQKRGCYNKPPSIRSISGSLDFSHFSRILVELPAHFLIGDPGSVLGFLRKVANKILWIIDMLLISRNFQDHRPQSQYHILFGLGKVAYQNRMDSTLLIEVYSLEVVPTSQDSTGKVMVTSIG